MLSLLSHFFITFTAQQNYRCDKHLTRCLRTSKLLTFIIYHISKLFSLNVKLYNIKMMNYRIYFKRTTFFFILTLLTGVLALAQTAKLPEPREQKLLNGLKLLVWNDPTAKKITLKLRVHSGAAFDPKDKMGAMALLSDILFPNDQSKAFFTEDLEGSLEVTTTFDYLQITATGKSEEVVAMIQTIANALINPQITPETFKVVREARLKKVLELEKMPSYIADRAIAKRLFGDFPYGRSAEGTPQSLAKLDYADLLFAKERFLTPDNATLAIIGNIKADYAYRASRQLFGAWIKSEKKIPATFRQPDEIIKGKQFIQIADSEKAEILQATRSFARGSKDYLAGLIMTDILAKRLIKVGAEFNAKTSVANNSYLLFGNFIARINISPEKAADFSKEIQKVNLIKTVSDSEFAESKDLVVSEMTKSLTEKTTNADFWLDADTYKLLPVSDQFSALQKVTITEVNNVLSKVFNTAFVETVVGDANKLKDFVSNE